MSKLTFRKICSEITDNFFDCGNASINSQIHESYYPTLLQHGYTFEVSYNNQIVGYYMINLLSLELNQLPGSISDFQCNLFANCSSVHIKYIAVKKEYQHRGIGSRIMDYIVASVFEICERWPIRLITLDALSDKYDWYKRRGFSPLQNPVSDSTIRMYMDCCTHQVELNNYVSTYEG